MGRLFLFAAILAGAYVLLDDNGKIRLSGGSGGGGGSGFSTYSGAGSTVAKGVVAGVGG